MSQAVSSASLAFFLDRATNALGDPLTPDCRARVAAAVDRPGPDTWDAAHSVILSRDLVTLWIAVVIVARGEPPRLRRAPGARVWENLPTAAGVAAGLRYATS